MIGCLFCVCDDVCVYVCVCAKWCACFPVAMRRGGLLGGAGGNNSLTHPGQDTK